MIIIQKTLNIVDSDSIVISESDIRSEYISVM